MSGNLSQRVIELGIQGKPTRGRKKIGMLSGLIGKDYASLKKSRRWESVEKLDNEE